jgi:transcriptional regulator of NAD metabolism
MNFKYQTEKKITEFTTEELRAELDKRRFKEEIIRIVETGGEMTNVQISRDICGGISVSFDINGGA